MRISELYNQVLREEMNNLFYHGSPYAFDRFDFTKIGRGDGLNKYGYGLYFADDENTAMYYAKELSIGHLKASGFNLYTVKLMGLNQFYEWEGNTPTYVQDCIMAKLHRMGKEDEVQQIASEYEEYGSTWSMRSMYEYLTHVLGTPKEVSEFLNICGVNGVVVDAVMHNGKIFVAYADDVIRILDVNKII